MTPVEIAALPRPLAFVLPGGGALGSYQVGVSAGSVNAALFAWNGGLDGLDHMADIWRGIRRRALMRVHPGRLARAFAGQQTPFLDNRHGCTFLRRYLGNRASIRPCRSRWWPPTSPPANRWL
ncbi:MAG: hypothetical protein LH616_03500 [Ilumatobacteraceae bacterium]|nr:hypothetical protein [Ilumatobacteraceae bacterium]